MVQGRPGQAHRPGHVRKDLIPKKPDGFTGQEITVAALACNSVIRAFSAFFSSLAALRRSRTS